MTGYDLLDVTLQGAASDAPSAGQLPTPSDTQDIVEEVPRTVPPEPLPSYGVMPTPSLFDDLSELMPLPFWHDASQVDLADAFGVDSYEMSSVPRPRMPDALLVPNIGGMHVQDAAFAGAAMPAQGRQLGNEVPYLTEFDLTQESLSMLSSGVSWDVSIAPVAPAHSYYPHQFPSHPVPPAALSPAQTAPPVDYQPQNWTQAVFTQVSHGGALPLQAASQPSVPSQFDSATTATHNVTAHAASGAMAQNAAAAHTLSVPTAYNVPLLTFPSSGRLAAPFHPMPMGMTAPAPSVPLWTDGSVEPALLQLPPEGGHTLLYAPGPQPAATVPAVPQPHIALPYADWPNQALDTQQLAAAPVSAPQTAPENAPENALANAPPSTASFIEIGHLPATADSSQADGRLSQKRPFDAAFSDEHEGSPKTTGPGRFSQESTGQAETETQIPIQAPADSAALVQEQQDMAREQMYIPLADYRRIPKRQQGRRFEPVAVDSPPPASQPVAATSVAGSPTPIVIPDSPGDQQAHQPISIISSAGVRLRGDTFIGEPVTVISRFGKMSFGCYVPGPPRYKFSRDANAAPVSTPASAPASAPDFVPASAPDSVPDPAPIPSVEDEGPASERPHLPIMNYLLRSRGPGQAQFWAQRQAVGPMMPSASSGEPLSAAQALSDPHLSVLRPVFRTAAAHSMSAAAASVLGSATGTSPTTQVRPVQVCTALGRDAAQQA